MITEKTLIEYGYVKDENNLKFKEMFKDNAIIKEIHIDMHFENPFVSCADSFMLLLRTIEKNVTVENDDNRIVLKRSDRYQTHFMNILLSKITDCFCNITDICSEFILNIQNIYYRIIVLN